MHRSQAHRLLAPSFGAFLAILASSPAMAITTQRVASALSRPIFVTAPPGDERLFIVEQRGVIKILKNGQVLATPFLDIDDLIPDIGGNDERGLLGLAFHPDFEENRQFYVNYINLSSDTVIARYRASATDPDVAVRDSSLTILTIDQPATNHNGGTLLFGPQDGYLYIGMGDGGGAGDVNNYAQRDDTLLGKFLRIDVDGGSPYAIPPDNPFVGPGDPLDEIWSKGWRNPYRWSFDRATGDLLVGDVGQNRYEEVDFEPADSPGGGNYGWRLMEGEHCYNPPDNCDDGTLIHPIHEYAHAGIHCSVTGGYVYRGTAIPSLQGTYFFADFCSDSIWTFRYDGQVLSELTNRTAELAPGGGLLLGDIAGFGEDGFGELYIADRGSGANGEIYKLVQSPAGLDGEAPDARRALGVVPNPSRGATSLSVTLGRPGEVSLEIIDAAGRAVRALETRALPAGTHKLEWDGRDAAGRGLPSGLYFLRARIDGESFTRSVCLIR